MARPDTTPHARNDPPARPGGTDLNVTTLVIAAAASAAAAFVTSRVWAGGTLWSAAMTPVIVALVKEALSRPAEKVRTVRTTRATAYEIEPHDEMEGEMSPVTVYGGGGRRRRPRDGGDARRRGARVAGDDEGGRRPRLTPKRIRLAVVTGLLAFAVVVVAYTLPELVSGRSIGDSGNRRTTLFGGSARDTRDDDKEREKATPTPTPGGSGTATPQATATPGATATPTATPTATASPPAGLAVPAPTPTPTPSSAP